MKDDFERKFLVVDNIWKSLVLSSESIEQGYFANSPEVRVRIKNDQIADLAMLGDRVNGSHQVFEYPIPLEDAIAMLAMAKRVIRKVRYRLEHEGQKWTVEEFSDLAIHGNLTIAKTKIASIIIPIPSWAGDEITENTRYSNINLAWQPK